MVEYACEVCGKKFESYELTKQHESIPINEGFFHGVILKQGNCFYSFFKRREELDGNHDRLYFSFCFHYVDNPEIIEGLKRRFLCSPFKYSTSDLEGFVKDGHYLPLIADSERDKIVLFVKKLECLDEETLQDLRFINEEFIEYYKKHLFVQK